MEAMLPCSSPSLAVPKRLLAGLLSLALACSSSPAAQAAAYDGRPKLVVLIVIDQFRADYLQRYRSEFKGRGFRLFLDRGAYFPDCYYGYANTKTAPGHATLGTGAYSDGHGINSNEWWDLARNKQRPVSSVEDDRYSVVSPDTSGPLALPVAVQAGEAVPAKASAAPAQNDTAKAETVSNDAAKAGGASPRNLLASTIGDELRLATAGQSRVYGVSLKDRAAILPAGASANGAFWIDAVSGRFVTSSYYMTTLPQWALDFDSGPAIAGAAAAAGFPPAGTPTGSGSAALTNFYNQVGATDAANSYELAFSEALITGEQLGSHFTTDLLTVSLSPNDLEGHRFGPDSPEERAMVLGLDADLDGFAAWLDAHVPGGLGNVWIAISADHGVAPTPAVSDALGLPGAYISTDKLVADLNRAMNAKFSPGENVRYLLPHADLPYLSLDRPNFERAGINEQEAEDAVKAAMEPAFASLAAPPGTMLPAPAAPVAAAPPAPASPEPAPARGTASGRKTGSTRRGTQAAPGEAAPAPAQPPSPAPSRAEPNPQLYRAYTRQQLAAGDVPPSEFGRMLAHSYSPVGGWYVAAFPIAFQMQGSASGTTHFAPWSYDRHVPLGFYGSAFLPGTYRGRVEPVDLAATLASLLGVNQPSASVGTVLTQALRPAADFQYPKEPAAPRHARRATHSGPEAGAAAPAGDPR